MSSRSGIDEAPHKPDLQILISHTMLVVTSCTKLKIKYLHGLFIYYKLIFGNARVRTPTGTTCKEVLSNGKQLLLM